MNTPCKDRQNSSCPKVAEVAANAEGSDNNRAAGIMMFRRHQRSARSPTRGAVMAMAAVETVMIRLTRLVETWNRPFNNGRRGCGA